MPYFKFSFNEIISVTMILFGIIDILGAIPVIIQLRNKAGHIQSEKASFAVLVLMIVFLFVGEQLLGVIGLDVSSFAIAGSFVIFFIAMEMILGINLFKEEMPESVSIVPLAFPLIAGSGTLTKNTSASSTLTLGYVAYCFIFKISICHARHCCRYHCQCSLCLFCA